MLAATNIFTDLAAMQELKFPPLREDEQILWYLMRLERDLLCTEEDLYKLSDAAKKLGARMQIGKVSFFFSGLFAFDAFFLIF